MGPMPGRLLAWWALSRPAAGVARVVYRVPQLRKRLWVQVLFLRLG